MEKYFYIIFLIKSYYYYNLKVFRVLIKFLLVSKEID